jgi:death-on-curing protein
MSTRYLTKSHIIAIHYELIERFGGVHGIRDEALLESAIGRYRSGYYADRVEEAAALMESLGGNHPFIDGNKRIAVTAAFVFLALNGYDVTVDEDAAFEFIHGLFNTHEFSFSHLESWLRDQARRV